MDKVSKLNMIELDKNSKENRQKEINFMKTLDAVSKKDIKILKKNVRSSNIKTNEFDVEINNVQKLCGARTRRFKRDAIRNRHRLQVIWCT